jgi:hypothetical protein
LDGIAEHKDGGVMRKLTLLAFVMTALTAASALAGSNADHKVAIHVALHDGRNCNSGLPDIRSCKDIDYTYDGCMDVDVFPIFYDLAGVRGIQIGLTWPASWGSCAFTACGFDYIIGEIVNPEDGFAGTWAECQYVRQVIAGYGWLGPSSGGFICPVPNRITGRIGVADCDFVEDPPAEIYCGGACGKRGDDPCGGGFSEDKTWGNIKAMFR